MDNVIGKVFSMGMVVLLLFIYPLMQMLDHQDASTRVFVLTETTKLVDSVRNIGRLTPQMYETYLNKISATGLVYEISLEHLHRQYDPIYIDPLDEASFQNDYRVNFRNFYTEDILDGIYPDGLATGEYAFDQRDYFSVRLVNKTATLGTKMKKLFFGGSLPDETIFIQYGGMIK